MNEKEATELLASITGDLLLQSEELFGTLGEQSRILIQAYNDLHKLIDTMKGERNR